MTFQVALASGFSRTAEFHFRSGRHCRQCVEASFLREIETKEESAFPPATRGESVGNFASPASRVLRFASVSIRTRAAAPAPNAFLTTSCRCCWLAPSGSLTATTAPFVKVPPASATCNSPLIFVLLRNETRKSRPYCHFCVLLPDVTINVGGSINFADSSGTRCTNSCCRRCRYRRRFESELAKL